MTGGLKYKNAQKPNILRQFEFKVINIKVSLSFQIKLPLTPFRFSPFDLLNFWIDFFSIFSPAGLVLAWTIL